MRIGIDARELRAGVSTGIGRYLRGFLRYAAERREGHEFLLYGDRATAFSDFPWAQPRVVPGRWPFSDLWFLPRMLGADRVDVFFSPYYKAPRPCPCPYVVTIHDLIFSNGWKDAAKEALLVSSARRIARAAAGVITVSEYSKAEIVRRLGLEGGRVDVVPNAVPEGFRPVAEADRAAALKRNSLKPGFVLFVGSFKPSKNVEGLVEAYAGLEAQLRARHPLVIVAPAGAASRAFWKRWGAKADAAGIRPLSGVPDQDIAALYSACVLCVVPSWAEGFGMPALEAMACGAPVLVSDRTSLPEVVGGAGEISAPDPASLRGAMARLLSDAPRREELGRRGLERSRSYSYAEGGEKIFSILRRCAKAR